MQAGPAGGGAGCGASRRGARSGAAAGSTQPTPRRRSEGRLPGGGGKGGGVARSPGGAGLPANPGTGQDRTGQGVAGDEPRPNFWGRRELSGPPRGVPPRRAQGGCVASRGALPASGPAAAGAQPEAPRAPAVRAR